VEAQVATPNTLDTQGWPYMTFHLVGEAGTSPAGSVFSNWLTRPVLVPVLRKAFADEAIERLQKCLTAVPALVILGDA
jgi:hypothetical protein